MSGARATPPKRRSKVAKSDVELLFYFSCTPYCCACDAPLPTKGTRFVFGTSIDDGLYTHALRLCFSCDSRLFASPPDEVLMQRLRKRCQELVY